MAGVTNVAASGNQLINTLAYGTKWNTPGQAKTVITVGYHVSSGYVAPTTAELNAIKSLEALFEKYLNIDIQYVGFDPNSAADITFGITTDSNETSLGWAELPSNNTSGENGEPNSWVAIMRHNYAPGATLLPGSYDYITYVHEFGHALGLNHPHDSDGLLGGAFPGVTSEFDDLGTHNLNQGVFTTMTYNDGWRTGPTQPTSSNFGYQRGPMALDIMALQYLYGVNSAYAADNTSYELPSVNGGGTRFACIWDTGGTDSFSVAATLTKACTIDLRQASGAVAVGGGGFVSHVSGVVGGFTIAKGTLIENAFGGAGNDTIIGNGVANVILGRNGKDSMWGGGGADTFDFNSTAQSGATASTADIIRDFSVTSGDVIDLLSIDTNAAAGDQGFAFRGNSGTFTAAAQVRWQASGTDTLVYINFDADQTAESIIRLTGLHNLTANDFLL